MTYSDPPKMQAVAIALGYPLESNKHPNTTAILNSQTVIGSMGWTGTLWY